MAGFEPATPSSPTEGASSLYLIFTLFANKLSKGKTRYFTKARSGVLRWGFSVQPFRLTVTPYPVADIMLRTLALGGSRDFAIR